MAEIMDASYKRGGLVTLTVKMKDDSIVTVQVLKLKVATKELACAYLCKLEKTKVLPVKSVQVIPTDFSFLKGVKSN